MAAHNWDYLKEEKEEEVKMMTEILLSTLEARMIQQDCFDQGRSFVF